MPAHHDDEAELRRLVTEPPTATGRVSSFMALVSDARRVAWREQTSGELIGGPAERLAQGAIWAGSLLYLVLVDQIGNCFRNPDRTVPFDKREFFRGMQHFADPTPPPEELFALYALRCSFAHRYSAANLGEGRDAVSLHHRFQLLWEPETALIGGLDDGVEWDGKYNRAALTARITRVNLYAVEEMVERMIGGVQRTVQMYGGRALATNTWAEFFTQYTFDVTPRPALSDAQVPGGSPVLDMTPIPTESPAASGVPAGYHDRWLQPPER